MIEYQWELLVRIPDNHKFFFDQKSQRLAVCDYSGTTPELTDDGVLWVIVDKPLLFSNDGNQFSTPVFSVRKGEESHCSSGFTEALWLVRKFGMQLQLQDGEDSMLLVPVTEQVQQTRHPLVPL